LDEEAAMSEEPSNAPGERSNDPNVPEEPITDLTPDEAESESVTGGAPINLGGIEGESSDVKHTDWRTSV
jgi:hypothetical protein